MNGGGGGREREAGCILCLPRLLLVQPSLSQQHNFLKIYRLSREERKEDSITSFVYSPTRKPRRASEAPCQTSCLEKFTFSHRRERRRGKSYLSAKTALLSPLLVRIQRQSVRSLLLLLPSKQARKNMKEEEKQLCFGTCR